MKSLTSLLTFGILLSACAEKPSAKKAEEPVSVTAPQTFNETPLKAGLLEGTYLNAGAQTPIALIVPGSGPTDRDGNSPAGIAAAPYKHLARQLSSRKISTVRVDKYGMFGSAEAGDPNAVTVEMYAGDYRAWIDVIKSETGQDCVYLVGHSEGALMVSAAAVDRDDVCGLVLLAGPGRSFGDILREQLSANPANIMILKSANDAIANLEAGEQVDVSEMHPALQNLFHPQVQDYLISLMAVDPADVAARAGKPTLIIQGENDIQVTPEDARILAEATGGTLVLLPGVNHVLKVAPQGRMVNMATYSNPDLPVAEGVLDAIVEFMKTTE